MVALENVGLVFVAGFITALATGLGAIPFFFFDDISTRWNVALWGLASGIMVSASVFGLILEGAAVVEGTWTDVAVAVGPGLLAGVALVVVGHEVLEGAEVHPKKYEEADFKKLVLILGILTVHSFPEGVAVGVSFAELGLAGVPASDTIVLGTLTLPVLAVLMTIAISIHNVPEGVAISIPLRSMTLATQFLPFGFGFAAGAMIYLVAREFIPEALDHRRELPRGGRPELTAGIVAGGAVMVPLAFI